MNIHKCNEKSCTFYSAKNTVHIFIALWCIESCMSPFTGTKTSKRNEFSLQKEEERRTFDSPTGINLKPIFLDPNWPVLRKIPKMKKALYIFSSCRRGWKIVLKRAVQGDTWCYQNPKKAQKEVKTKLLLGFEINRPITKAKVTS